MPNYAQDPRIVMTLDAGGTNFVFSAMQANRPAVESFALPSNADNLERSLATLVEGFRRDALSYLLFLRLVPAFPFFIVNIAAALLGVPLKTYVTGTVIGVIPATLAFASIGAGLDSVVAEQDARHAVVAGDLGHGRHLAALAVYLQHLGFGAAGDALPRQRHLAVAQVKPNDTTHCH